MDFDDSVLCAPADIEEFRPAEMLQLTSLLDDIPQLLDISHEMQDELDYMVALLGAIEGHVPGLYEDDELNFLVSYVNDAPAAYMFLARDLLTQQGFHFPPIIYLDSHRPEQLTEETEEEEGSSRPETMVMDKEIIVFPNPASRELNFYWNSNPLFKGNLRISLYNSLGVLIAYEEIDAEAGKHSFKVNSYPSGLYFYRVGDSHGKTFHGNVQILH